MILVLELLLDDLSILDPLCRVLRRLRSLCFFVKLWLITANEIRSRCRASPSADS